MYSIVTIFFNLFAGSNLELHVVGLVVVSQGEFSIEVSLEHWYGVNGLHQSSINSLLVSLALVRDDSGLRGISGEELLLLSRCSTSKVGIVEGRNINRGYINLGRGGDNVGWADTTERNTVNLVGSRNKDKSRFKNLKGDNALSTETSSEKDQDSSRCDRGTDLGWVLLALARRKRGLDIISRVVL